MAPLLKQKLMADYVTYDTSKKVWHLHNVFIRTNDSLKETIRRMPEMEKISHHPGRPQQDRCHKGGAHHPAAQSLRGYRAATRAGKPQCLLCRKRATHRPAIRGYYTHDYMLLYCQPQDPRRQRAAPGHRHCDQRGLHIMFLQTSRLLCLPRET